MAFKQKRFSDIFYIERIATYLGITSYLNLRFKICLHNLKNAKATYLKAKEDYQKLRDRFANNNSENPKLVLLRKRERMKMHWKSLKKYFSKLKMNSISVVEYKVNGTLVRTSSQF